MFDRFNKWWEDNVPLIVTLAAFGFATFVAYVVINKI